MQYESRWRRINRQNEEARKKEINNLKNKITTEKVRASRLEKLCFEQREILREIIAICTQEELGFLDINQKLKRIEEYARRALATK